MATATGTKLGPHEALAPIGSGGMGEVWRARDTRLDRDVAIKVPPEEFFEDKERRERFEREAKLLAAVNHPSIAAVFSFEEISGRFLLVSELLKGETLRLALAEGALPVRRALEIGEKIAQGLAAAHEKGIVHRDLKPENVFLTGDGNVKILDFGLARHEAAASGPEDAKSPTLAKLTGPGVVFGTVAYLSPEQARGGAIDLRSDQFSLGTILYEMLAGERPFNRPSQAETMAAIIREEPAPLGAKAPTVPAPVRWIVERCLSKEPSGRYASTRDLARDLATCRLHLSEAVSAPVAAAPSKRAQRGRAALALGIAAAIVLVVSLGILFAGFRGGREQLFVRSIDRDEMRELAGTEGAACPFFSPVGLWVGFFDVAERKLKKVALAGGLPVALCDASDNRGGSWGADGTIVFVPAPRAGLQRIPASGGVPKAVTTPDPAKLELHYHPQFLPDGEHVLFEFRYVDRTSQAAVVSLRTGERRIILEDAGYPRYLPAGHLVFARAGVLYAAPFSLELLQTTGPPVPLLDDVYSNRQGIGSVGITYSQGGTVVYVPYRESQRTLVWVDRRGAMEQAPFPPGGYSQVTLSPAGARLAAAVAGKAEEWSFFLGDITRGTLTRSTVEGTCSVLAWTPDGRRIAYGFRPEGKRLRQVLWQSADESAPPDRLGVETANRQEEPTSFSPGGAALLIEAVDLGNPSPAGIVRLETFVLPLTGERKPRPSLRSRFRGFGARFSPDGRWVAYMSDESDRYEIHVQSHPGPGPKWQVSTEGGREEHWSRSGRELFSKGTISTHRVTSATAMTSRPTARASS